MTKRDLAELLELKGWSQAELARQLDVSPAIVCLWITGKREVMGPSRILLRQWLDQARGTVEREPAGAQ